MIYQHKIFLHPGTITVSDQDKDVTTILGSCVAVCLYDSALRVGGINHYMLPMWNGKGLASARYGNIAIEMLLKKMQELGCQNSNIIAKVFGGANQSMSNFTIGERNIEVAGTMMRESNIKIVAENTGGNQGRKLVFNPVSGKVKMKFVASS